MQELHRAVEPMQPVHRCDRLDVTKGSQHAVSAYRLRGAPEESRRPSTKIEPSASVNGSFVRPTRPRVVDPEERRCSEPSWTPRDRATARPSAPWPGWSATRAWRSR